MQTLEEFIKTNRYFVVAHRGSSGTAPENTLSAFREAIASGAKMIESDIQLTSDGHIIAFHDKGLSRTTNGSGWTSQTPLEELKKLDAGSWFGEKYINEKIPTLEEIFDLIKGSAFINIEVKNIHCDYDTEGIKKIISVVKKTNFRDYILFSSFYYNSLLEIKKCDPLFHTAAIRIPKDKTLPSVISKAIGTEAFVCSVDELNQEVSDDAMEKNIYIGVYSVDDVDSLDKILNFNVHAIVTNYPAKIISELKSRKLLT